MGVRNLGFASSSWGDGANHEGQRLVPWAQVRFQPVVRRFHIDGVGNQNVIDALLHQILHVPVRHLHREARLGDGQLIARHGNLAVGGWRNDHIETQLLEVCAPEGEAVVIEHGARNSHRADSAAAGRQLDFFQQLLAPFHQVLNHRLAVGRARLRNLSEHLSPQ